MTARGRSAFWTRDLAGRDIALDALRGLFVLGMIFVNHSPVNAPVFPPFVHAPWHGWTFADTIFPGFLFCVGISIRLAMVDGMGRPLRPTGGVWIRVLRRFALLLVLSFLLENFPYYELEKLRFAGTLALIAWCYLLASVLHLLLGWRAQLAAVVGALGLQWAAYTLLPVPGAGVLSPESNPARFVDLALLSPLLGVGHLPNDRVDDLILLPTLGAIATTLIGLLVGHWVRSARARRVHVRGLAIAGFALVALGVVWNMALPINKPLWTGSYVALMAGISMLLLALLYWITDLTGRVKWVRPLQVAGVNALFFYVFAQSLQRILVYGRLPEAGGGTVRLREWIYREWFAGWSVPEVGSLVYALVFLAIGYAAVLVLYRKRLFFKL
ncbi:MAG TPA: hypothetical protein VFP58_15105 [Candidatus Eisenbacteria bacterium]|nr:hypothetical protein [Candidatus Eisenbacteria bacterium]